MVTTTQRMLIELWKNLQARDAIDALAVKMWPHDVYRQTVAVMGFDPLPPVVVEHDDAANIMPPDHGAP